jgi:hypothetical protein
MCSFRCSARKQPSPFPLIQFEPRHDILGAEERAAENNEVLGEGITIRQLLPQPDRGEEFDRDPKRFVWEGPFCGQCAWVARTPQGLVRSGLRTSLERHSGLFEAEKDCRLIRLCKDMASADAPPANRGEPDVTGRWASVF